MDIKFSPNQNVLALGQITGEVRVYTYSEAQTSQMLHFTYHEDSCRRICFNDQGNILYSVSVDGSIAIISNGKLEGRITNAHKGAINSVIHVENGAIIATGDDDGRIKIWDLRIASSSSVNKACIVKFSDHEGTISDMVTNADNTMLLSSSNDGHLGVYDLR